MKQNASYEYLYDLFFFYIFFQRRLKDKTPVSSKWKQMNRKIAVNVLSLSDLSYLILRCNTYKYLYLSIPTYITYIYFFV